MPYQTVFEGISLVTTLPAPTKEYLPIFIPATIVAFAPIEAPSQIRVRTKFQSFERDLGTKSFVNVTLGPIKTLSSIVTPSQTWTPGFIVT